MANDHRWIEGQVDRIVGPTHHFSGLGVGNVASQIHRGQPSNPAAAALQGLDKMRLVATLGVPQWILPPQQRPNLEFLRSIGFVGSDRDILRRAGEESTCSLSAAMSCSAMWTANAATVTPACDNTNGSTCVTVANLNASLHRAIEPDETLAELKRILPPSFRVFNSLPGGAAMRDEGAANHMRLATDYRMGIHLFIYGDGEPRPECYWPRQTLAASQAVARLHQVDEGLTFFWRQHPKAIDAGAFHNDVVAMSDRDLLIYHESAYDEPDSSYRQLDEQFMRRTGGALTRVAVEASCLSLKDAVRTYLFNSQILSVRDRDTWKRIILCPVEVAEDANARRLVEAWHREGLFAEVHFVDLGQSMDGGGGPACLRLRIPLRASEVDSMAPNCRWSERVDEQLRKAIDQTYPTRVTIDDLSNIEFVEQAARAHQRVVEILMVG